MKKIVYFIAAIAIIGMTFTGCQKDNDEMFENSNIINSNKQHKALMIGGQTVHEIIVNEQISTTINNIDFNFYVTGNMLVGDYDGRICLTNLTFSLYSDNSFSRYEGDLILDATPLPGYESIMNDLSSEIHLYEMYINNVQLDELFNDIVGNIRIDYYYMKLLWHILLDNINGISATDPFGDLIIEAYRLTSGINIRLISEERYYREFYNYAVEKAIYFKDIYQNNSNSFSNAHLTLFNQTTEDLICRNFYEQLERNYSQYPYLPHDLRHLTIKYLDIIMNGQYIGSTNFIHEMYDPATYIPNYDYIEFMSNCMSAWIARNS